MTLDELNRLDASHAEAEFLKCCHSVAWARDMARARPFADREVLLARADAAWAGVGPADRLEAFAGHPRIGEKVVAGWASQEQAGARGASPATIAALVEGNREYEAKFGHVFLICATGRSADEMLAALRARLPNSIAQELANASDEQAKITRLRLDRLLSQ